MSTRGMDYLASLILKGEVTMGLLGFFVPMTKVLEGGSSKIIFSPSKIVKVWVNLDVAHRVWLK